MPTRGSQPGSIALPDDRSTLAKPALVDRTVDFDLRRLWREIDVAGKPTAIARALTAEERHAIERRIAELQIGCSPFTLAEESAAIAPISRMLGGFRSMRHEDDESAVAALHGLRHVLAPFPVWAIEAGCLSISRDEAMIGDEKLSRKFPPNDSEIYAVIRQIVKPYLAILADAEWLLSAPIITKLAKREAPVIQPDQPAPASAQPTEEEAVGLPARRFVVGDELDGWRVVTRILGQSELQLQSTPHGDGIWMLKDPEADLVAMSIFADEGTEGWQVVEERSEKFAAWRDRLELWTGKRPSALKLWLEPRNPSIHGLPPSDPNFRLRRSTSGFRVPETPSGWPPRRDGTWGKPEAKASTGPPGTETLMSEQDADDFK